MAFWGTGMNRAGFFHPAGVAAATTVESVIAFIGWARFNGEHSMAIAKRSMKLFPLCFLLLTHYAVGGEIALTFDDAPLPDSPVMTGDMRTQQLIAELAKAKAPPVVFFATGKHIDAQSQARLHRYAKAGHYLANHSFEHLSANDITAEAFMLDAYKMHLTLKSYPRVLPLFRFPYLHQGNDSKSRAKISAALAELGYSIGYVTVDNFDWYIDARYRAAVSEGKRVNMENLGRLYVDTLWQAIQFYDQLARKTLGRSPKHVLLLHENDLAATFIGQLIDHLHAQGWTVISPVDAYKDPLAQTEHDLSFTKQGRVAALAHEAGIGIEMLRSPGESTEAIDQLFLQYEVIAVDD